MFYNSKPPNKPAAAPTKPPPEIMPLTAAPALEACADAEPVREALGDVEALPEPGVGVALVGATLAVEAPCEELSVAPVASLPLTEPVRNSFSVPAVTVTVRLPTSVPSYVSVLLPGKFASLPPAVSLHTALLAAITQSWVAVKSVLGSDMSTLYVDGPTTRVWAGKRPQSSDGRQASARVVAPLLAVTTEAAMEFASPPTLGTVSVRWAMATLSMVERMSVGTISVVEMPA